MDLTKVLVEGRRNPLMKRVGGGGEKDTLHRIHKALIPSLIPLIPIAILVLIRSHCLIQVLVMKGTGRRNPPRKINSAEAGKPGIHIGGRRRADKTNQGANLNGLVFSYL